MTAVAARMIFTPQEYLALERKAKTRSEYVNGEIYAMAGASREHNLISLNVGSELRSQLRKRPCETYTNDMRVRVKPTGLYTYPDVVVVCGHPRFEDAESDTLVNPTVIAEALSPTTEGYDRGGKFAHYRYVDSLQEYVLIAQERMQVDHFARMGQQWLLTSYSRPDEILSLPSIDCAVPLSEIYARVELSTENNLARE